MFLNAVPGNEFYDVLADGSTDVYDSDGAYIGTIPPDAGGNPTTNVTDWTNVAKGLVTTWQGIQTSKINVERAQRGLPPLDLATATVGLQPSQMRQVMLLGAAALAVLFFALKKR